MGIFCIASLCGEAKTKALIASGLCHIVNVQNARPLVLRKLTPRLPAVFVAWRADLLLYQKKAGKKRTDLR